MMIIALVIGMIADKSLALIEILTFFFKAYPSYIKLFKINYMIR